MFWNKNLHKKSLTFIMKIQKANLAIIRYDFLKSLFIVIFVPRFKQVPVLGV